MPGAACRGARGRSGGGDDGLQERIVRHYTVSIKTAVARSSLPAFIEPQLATLVPQAPAGDDWLHELKFDGYRILARLENERVTLLSRRAKDWTTKFPGVRAAVAKLRARTAM